jgi:hypothetical protein
VTVVAQEFLCDVVNGETSSPVLVSGSIYLAGEIFKSLGQELFLETK